jgi:hypothetical protein
LRIPSYPKSNAFVSTTLGVKGLAR